MQKTYQGSKEKGKKEVRKSFQTKVQLAVIAALVVFFIAVIRNQNNTLHELDAQVADTDRRIALELEIAENLRIDEAYLRSDEFVKKIAYERLNLVGDNDIIFVKRRR
jgi:cell division protein FtsB